MEAESIDRRVLSHGIFHENRIERVAISLKVAGGEVVGLGRAGRYGSKFPVGEVTCLNEHDLPLLHLALESSSPVLERAGLFPTYDLLLMYSCLHPTLGFHPILERFLKNAKLSPTYFIGNCEAILTVAAVIDELPLGLHEKYLFCISPVDMEDGILAQGLTQFATNYANKGLVRLRQIFTPGTLKVPKTQGALKSLESIHKVLDLYIWLSFRMGDAFPDQELASSQKTICNMCQVYMYRELQPSVQIGCYSGTIPA
ncbi:hypothetical protein GIB67_020376 [Kingdonia uniflora]|uniref:RNA helicase n=1 Tax=Kingdonia uniflora TaxID=39325 RepID=A0A7J7LBI3_9MAGN|nr:hypothetical protein GIB67_020376 [Kingdonia uniflora]